jgi:hypothetical protein
MIFRSKGGRSKKLVKQIFGKMNQNRSPVKKIKAEKSSKKDNSPQSKFSVKNSPRSKVTAKKSTKTEQFTANNSPQDREFNAVEQFAGIFFEEFV